MEDFRVSKMAYSLAIVIFVMGGICFDWTAACSCAPPNLTQIYKSDYVIKAKVIKENGPIYPKFLPPPFAFDEQFAVYQYEVDILEIIRSSYPFEISRKVLQTAGSDALCGIRLTEGDTYIIGGYVVKDTAPTGLNVLGFNLCNIIIGANNGNHVEENLAVSTPDCTNKKIYTSNTKEEYNY